MNKGEWGKIKACFDVTTEEGFVIKGFKYMREDNKCGNSNIVINNVFR